MYLFIYVIISIQEEAALNRFAQTWKIPLFWVARRANAGRVCSEDTLHAHPVKREAQIYFFARFYLIVQKHRLRRGVWGLSHSVVHSAPLSMASSWGLRVGLPSLSVPPQLICGFYALGVALSPIHQSGVGGVYLCIPVGFKVHNNKKNDSIYLS